MRFCDLWTRIGSRPMNLFNVHSVNVFVEQTRLTRSLMHPWWPCQICWIDSCWIRLINQTAPSLLFLYFFSFFFTFKFSSQITFRKLLTAWISDNIWFLFVDFLHVHLFDKYSIHEQFIFFYRNDEFLERWLVQTFVLFLLYLYALVRLFQCPSLLRLWIRERNLR